MMMERTITRAALIKHFGADTRELESLKLLFGVSDNFPEADCALALLDLRRDRRPVPAPARSGPLALLRKLRGANRRVPQEARRDG